MRERVLQDSQLRFYLALAFLLWSVLPHLSVYRHAHAGHGAGHDHATLTPAEIRLANQVAQTLTAEGEADFGGEALPGPLSRSGEPALQSASDAASHAHFQPDPNVVSLGLRLAVLEPASPPATVPTPELFRPDLGHRFERQARGPPSLPSA